MGEKENGGMGERGKKRGGKDGRDRRWGRWERVEKGDGNVGVAEKGDEGMWLRERERWGKVGPGRERKWGRWERGKELTESERGER